MTHHTWMILLIVLGIVCFLIAIWRWLNSPDTSTKTIMEQYGQRREAVMALPIEEARRQVEMLLRDPKVFKTVPATGPADNISVFAPGLQALFQDYEQIHTVDWTIYLNSKKIAPYRWDWEEGPWQEARFWHVGFWNGMSQAVILVKPNLEAVYVFFAGGTCISDPDETPAEREKTVEKSNYPSIYHYLLLDL